MYQTHLRAGFSHLAIALKHFQDAEEHPIEDEDDEESSPISDDQLENLIVAVCSSKNEESKISINNRLPSELFISAMEFADSPSLVMACSTCRSWRESILEATNLFGHFRMEGEASNIAKGINAFNARSGNSVRSIELVVKDRPLEPQELRDAILASSKSLETLSIRHQGDLCLLILEVAADCPLLQDLYSLRVGKGALYAGPLSSRASIKLPANFKLKLRNFHWNSGSEGLVWDDTLQKSLENAREVILCSYGISPSRVVQLLSSNSELVKLGIPWMEDDYVEEIPLMELPRLQELFLDQSPRIGGTSKSFYSNLQTPRLDLLRFKLLASKDLASLPADSAPRKLWVWKLLTESNGESATALSPVESMKNWGNTRSLHFDFQQPGSSRLSSDLIFLLTPYSRESIQAGYHDKIILPQLRSITLGRSSSSSETVIKGINLASLVASRLSISRGLGTGATCMAASGHLQSANSQRELGKPLPSLKCSSINLLDVKFKVEMDEATALWLKDNVNDLKLSLEKA